MEREKEQRKQETTRASGTEKTREEERGCVYRNTNRFKKHWLLVF